MKMFKPLTVLAIAFCILMLGNVSISAQEKTPKELVKLQEKAKKMTDYGAIAAVGIGVGFDMRMSKSMAEMDANTMLSKAKLVKMGLAEDASGTSSSEFTSSTTSGTLKGVRAEVIFFQTKENAQFDEFTAAVLHYISPNEFYGEQEEILKETDEAVYKVYLDSEERNKHQKIIKTFEKKFER
jgi:hypothetical protein